MKSLVLCPCGHPMDHHDDRGCAGERAFPCACRRAQERVLDDAIEAARSDPSRWQAHYGLGAAKESA